MTRDSLSPIQRVLSRPELVPGMLALGVFVAWSTAQAGYFPTSSAPGGLFLGGLLLAGGFAFKGRLGEVPRSLWIAIGLLAAFVAWSFLSITWADAKHVAWDGANRSLIYLLAFALFAIVPWRIRSAAAILGLWSLALAIVGTLTLIKASGAEDPIVYFISNLFSEPTGYHNANAAMFGIAFWPAVITASRREAPIAWRAVMLATALVLFELALLPQSRGWLIMFPIAGVVALAVVPGRVRLLATCVPLAVAAFLVASPMLEVFDIAADEGDLSAALDRAIEAMLLAALAMLAAGVALAGIDELLHRQRFLPAVKGAAAAVAIGALVVAVVAGLNETGNPVDWAEDRWADFRDASPREVTPGSRLGESLGSNRYDFWEVSIEAWDDQPLKGIGIDNFAADYLRERNSLEEPLHPHSLPVKIVSQTGLVGALLFAGFLSAAAVAILRVRFRATEDLARVIAGAVIVTFAYWFLHSSGDWFWPLPAITAPVFAWLGMAGSLSRAAPKPDEPSASMGRRSLAAGAAALAVALLTLGAAVSLILPWAARVDLDAAARGWRVDADAAYDRLDRAESLNFLSPDAALTEGAIAARLGEFGRMRSAFERALERHPQNWYALLELGALDALEGNPADARKRLAQARALNPSDPLIQDVQESIEEGRVYPLRRIDRALLDRVCGRLGRTAATEYCD